MDVIRTLLVDDHPLFAETIAARLRRESDLDVLPIAHDEGQARALLSTLSPDVVVLDLMLGTTSGLTLLDEIEASRAARVLILTAISTADTAVDAVRRGARGWLSKTVDSDHLVRVIRGVSRGESWIPPDILGYVLRGLTEAPDLVRSDLLSALTVREIDVLQYAVDGLSKSAIAQRLFLSPNTVRTHTQNMLGKLGTHSMLETVSLARRSGMRPSRS